MASTSAKARPFSASPTGPALAWKLTQVCFLDFIRRPGGFDPTKAALRA
jgi:hypothetical protein